jgi:hypothetical protein
MTEAEKSDRRSSGTHALGVGIAVGMILLLGLGWLGFESYRASQAAAAVLTQAPGLAAAWAEDIRAGRLDAAYRATTAAYRAHVDRPAFERWVAEHPELKLAPQPRGFSLSARTTGITIGITGIRITNPPPRMTYNTAYSPAGKEPSVLTIVVTSEGGPPLVDHAEIEPEPPSKP